MATKLNLGILAAITCIWCLAPLADVHIEVNSDQGSFVHGVQHSERSLALIVHELLFAHLKHQLDQATPSRLSMQLSASSKRRPPSPDVQCISITASGMVMSLPEGRVLQLDHRSPMDLLSREYSGLSPPSSLLI